MSTLTADPLVATAEPDRPSTPPRLSPPWTPRRIGLWAVSIGFVIGSIWGLRRVEMTFIPIIEGWPETKNLLDRMWPPFIQSGDRGAILGQVVDTFFMAFLGTVIGVVLSIPLGLAASANVVRSRWVRGAARSVIALARAVPALILALIFVRVFSIGVLPGVLALGLHSVGFCGKLFAGAADSIELGPSEGVASTGASRSQLLTTGIWSQMVPSVIAVSLYRLEINFREGTLLGVVGAGGVGLSIAAFKGSLRYQEMLGVTIVIIGAVIVMELLSSSARRTILGTADPFGTKASRRGHGVFSARLTSALRLDRKAARVVDATAPDDDPAASRSLTPPWTADRIRLDSFAVGGLVLFVLAFLLTDLRLGKFFGSLVDLPSILWKLVPRNFDFWTDRARADLIETIAIGLAATFMAMVLAVPVAFLASSNVAPNRWVYRGTRAMMIMIRAIPELIIAVIFVAAIGLGPRTGTIALTIGMFGFSTRLFADVIEEARSGPREGVISAGATRLQDTVSGVLPQVLPALLTQGLYVFDVSLRASTVLGIVGGGGIGFILQGAMKTLDFQLAGGLILCIFVLVSAIEALSNWVNRQVT